MGVVLLKTLTKYPFSIKKGNALLMLRAHLRVFTAVTDLHSDMQDSLMCFFFPVHSDFP